MPDQEELDRLRPAAVGIASIRIWCGFWLLIEAYLRVPSAGLASWRFPVELQQAAERCSRDGAFPFYRPVLDVIGDHPRVFAWLFMVAGFAVGTLLLIGLFTRAAAALMALYSVNLWMATVRRDPSSVGLAMTLAVTAFCLILADAGRFYGLDRLRLERPPERPADRLRRTLLSDS